MSKSDNLNRQEMVRVFEMHDAGKTNREIGRFLRRWHTAVGDVLNEKKHYRRLTRWDDINAHERARFVLELRRKRKKQGRDRGWLKSPEIRAHVLSCLCDKDKRWTPEMIAGTIGDYFPSRSLTAKAIYNFTKSHPEYKEYLREKGHKRQQRVGNRRSRFKEGVPEKRSIDARPEIVNNREEVGHFEADTVHSCKGSKAAVLTIRERSKRKIWYFPLVNLEANTILPVLMVFFQRLPSELRKSLTLDNGSEWSEAYHKLEKVLPEFKVYFCHPYQAYERGTVENANRQLRVFYPKGTDFSLVSENALKDTERIINNWPMKVLGWKSSTKAFADVELKLAA